MVLILVGDLVEDIVVWHRGPVAEATDNQATIMRSGGGSAANTAAAAAVDTPVRFIGRVGADPLGEQLCRDLAATGVDVRTQRAGRTGSIVILVDALGERTMFPDPAASAELDIIDPSWFDQMTWLHLTLYGFNSPSSGAAIIAASAAAHEIGAPVSLDLSSAERIQTHGPDQVRDRIRQLDPQVIFANREEAELVELSRVAADNPQLVCVIKDGPRPVEVLHAGTSELIATIPTQVRDTTGAGDVFAAGYLRAALAGGTPPDCARSGVVAATKVLATAGGRVGPPVS